MAYTGDQRRTYQRNRYHEQKAKQKISAKRGRPRFVVFALRVPDYWLAQMQRMATHAVATGDHPWKSVQEVGRALLAEGFKYISDEHTREEFAPMLQLQQQLEGMDRARTTAQQMAAMAKANVSSMLDIDQPTAALQYFASALEQAQKLPPTVWSAWLIKDLRRAFPPLAILHDQGKVPGVRLGKSSAKKRSPSRKSPRASEDGK